MKTKQLNTVEKTKLKKLRRHRASLWMADDTATEKTKKTN